MRSCLASHGFSYEACSTSKPVAAWVIAIQTQFFLNAFVLDATAKLGDTKQQE